MESKQHHIIEGRNSKLAVSTNWDFGDENTEENQRLNRGVIENEDQNWLLDRHRN